MAKFIHEKIQEATSDRDVDMFYKIGLKLVEDAKQRRLKELKEEGRI